MDWTYILVMTILMVALLAVCMAALTIFAALV